LSQIKLERPGSPFADSGVFYFGGAMAEEPCYRTVTEIEEVVRRFEDCSYAPEEFVHARHLTVAAWYFARFDEAAARERMRTGLRKFIAHHGKNGYHETITEFWLRLVEGAARAVRRNEADLVSLVNDVVGRCNDKNMIYAYYSRERLGSQEAKTGWIEPDLRSLSGSE
jgi:hypothetical protein